MTSRNAFARHQPRLLTNLMRRSIDQHTSQGTNGNTAYHRYDAHSTCFTTIIAQLVHPADDIAYSQSAQPTRYIVMCRALKKECLIEGASKVQNCDITVQVILLCASEKLDIGSQYWKSKVEAQL